MYKGIYVAMTGATLKRMELDNIANNLANASTNGYKRTSFSSRLYPLMEGMPESQSAEHPDARAMAFTGKYSIDSSQATVMTTGNPLDVAENGEGFFVVEAKGNKAFTRNGSFKLDTDGFLVTNNGYKVLGIDNKPINLGKNPKATPAIASDGTISVEGSTVGTLQVVKLADIQNLADSLYSGKITGTTQAQVKQGGLETSNVNPMRELVSMITAEREFQTILQMIKSFDQLSSQSNQLAKI